MYRSLQELRRRSFKKEASRSRIYKEDLLSGEISLYTILDLGLPGGL